MERLDVAVIGGGLGGLLTAALAGQNGLRAKVFEQAREPGGRGRTVQEQGFSLNLGPHALYLGGAAERVLRRLEVPLTGRKPDTRAAFLIDRGELRPLPASPVGFAFSELLSGAERIKLGRALWKIMSVKPDAVARQSQKEWLDAHVGGGAARGLLDVLIRVATYSDRSEQISAATAITQLRLAMRPGVVYLDGGWQRLVDTLSARVELEEAAHIERVSRKDGTFEIAFSSGRVVDARVVVLAVPPAVAAELLPAVAPMTEGLAPVKAACLDLALISLPRGDRKLAFGLSAPTYASVHTEWAKLAPKGGAVIHAAKYLREEEDPALVRAELEAMMDVFQPGWREVLVTSRFYPHLTVSNALPLARAGGHSARPGPEVPGVPGAFVVGDWVGADGHLLNGVAASAEATVEMIRVRQAAAA